ncbi:MAG: hypothetical protein CUR32_00515 [Flavobacterium sp.]|nr:MAG: hypothetical protein CUR32_00515 [Flavobacterium sp.] [Flavobacterium sp. FEMGT703F]
MKKLLKYILFFITFFSNAQCFDCAKNLGGHNGDVPAGIVKSNDGIYLLKNSANLNMFAGLDKYDFNCNLIWSKKFDDFNMHISDLTTDTDGNIYVLYSWRISSNAGYGPFLHEGLPMNPGLNLYKFTPNGNFVWHRFLGYGNLYNNLNKIYNYNNLLYIVSSHYGTLNVDNQYFFNFPYTNNTLPYICKVDLQSNLIDVQTFGTPNDVFTSSEMDSNGNIYLSSYTYSPILSSDIIKINSGLQTEWIKQISNGSVYRITNLHYNSGNGKLYTWGVYNGTVNVLGNQFVSNTSSVIAQSLLGEFNTVNGDIERISRFDNNLPVPYSNDTFFENKNNELYIFTSFRGTVNFPNATITSNTYDSGMYSSEDMVLFKVNLSDFSKEFILKSYGVPNLSYEVTDKAGPILFDNDILYITSAFESKPMLFNGTTINNNSGNSNADIMFYKFNSNALSSTGDFSLSNTCLNEITSFYLTGSFDSVFWNFGDVSSANNTATVNNPQHQFSGPGTYHVTLTVTCGTNTQTIEKDIVITNMPTINQINPIIQCETNYSSGISSEFDTSNINSMLIGNQQNVTIQFRNSNGVMLTSPLPNPYTNTNIGGDIVTAKVFFSNNPHCYVETNIHFNTLPKSPYPTLISPQTFCIQQNATLNDITITGQNIQWYDAQNGGNLLSPTSLLQDGVTYYASQTSNSCESSRVPVTINLQNTVALTGNNPQSFCALQNPTLNDLTINGTNINFYSSSTSTSILATNTLLVDGDTYYATQTNNGCESVNRLPITVNLIFSLNANNYSTSICDEGNDGTELVDLSQFDSNLLNSSGNTFTYYKSFNGAENQIAGEQFNVNHTINLGLNTIFVRIDSSNGCHQIVTLQLNLVPVPVIAITDEVFLCEGSNITVNAGTGFNSYSWSTGATSSSISINQAGNYSVTVTKNYGSVICSSTKSFTVTLSNAPTITSIDTIDWTDVENSITVNVSGLGDYEYAIDGINFQTSNTFSGLPNGNYLVTVRDKNNCGEDTEQVVLLNYPKFFTPNGDGKNDDWRIKFSQYEPNFEVRIFDRYGKLLKIMNNNEAWDGKNNGRQMPSDDYWFYVIRNDGRIHKGHFAMIR